MPPDPTVFDGLSPRLRSILEHPEGTDVEWKRDNKVDPEDLVAFANSARGGVVLLGVEQTVGSDGRQTPSVRGCRVGDHAVLEVVNKGKDCLPPLPVEVFTENARTTKPVLRVEVPSGPHRPYCTKAGVYKVRAQGRNAPLSPPELLALHLEVEGGRFLERYRAATERLEAAVESAIGQVQDRLSSVLDELARSGTEAVHHAENLHAEQADAVGQMLDNLHGELGRGVDRLESCHDRTEYQLDVLQAGVDALLAVAGQGSGDELYWRRRVTALVSIIRAAEPELSRPAVFAKVVALCHRCWNEELLYRLCVEQLGRFRRPRRQTKRRSPRFG